MTSNADRMALAEIRKAAGRSIPDYIWDQVETQVAEVGILGLSGTAAVLVHGIVTKHGNHNQQSHGGGSGGGSTNKPSTGSSSRGSGAGSLSDIDGKTNDPVEIKRRSDLDAESKKTIREAKGKGLQPADGRAEYWTRGVIGSGNAAMTDSSRHGAIMREARTNGGTPRVKTENGATAKIKGWKHRDDVSAGDVIALPGKYNKNPTYQITGVTGDGVRRRWTAVPIGRKGKPTGKPVELDGSQVGYSDEAITIVQPREIS